MKILSRVGSSVIVEAKDGSIWLTRRKKYKRAQHRRNWRRVMTRFYSVRYIPIKKLSIEEFFPKHDTHRCGDGHWPGLPFTL